MEAKSLWLLGALPCLRVDKKKHKHNMWEDHHRGREHRRTIRRGIWRRSTLWSIRGGTYGYPYGYEVSKRLWRRSINGRDFNGRRKNIDRWMLSRRRILIRKERLESQGTKTSKNILSSVRKMDPSHLVKWFWCLMINITLWTNVSQVFVLVVHRMPSGLDWGSEDAKP